MDLIFLLSIGFILVGFAAVILAKSRIEKQQGSTSLKVWWIVGTTVWGVISITLIPWLFNRGL
ncbi:hypothetical protein [Alteribacter natronophilus]|uniref:hypothetical protein n=1 Tax=Alteribacter natronophilus TaxID=2583810 RepID=UPI00110D8CA4|nr:hypothetical protein [Alteribacter natronophilus]TMW71462.1 hypothetical protein FGB90_10475 [Alteribacter natronophilus]